MNILIINASPRRDGCVSQMLGLVRKEGEARSAEVTVVRVADLQVGACIGCMQCRSRQECVLPYDDARKVLAMINEADAVIVGTPCYWGNIPGSLKVLFDRIVYGMMGESRRGMPLPLHKGKRAAFIATCSTPWPFNILFRQSRGAVKALREIFKWSGFKIVATVEKGGTKSRPSLTDGDCRACRKIVERLMK